MRIEAITMAAACLWLIGASDSFAADCGSIAELKGSTFSKHTEKIQHVMLSRLSKMTYEDAKQDFGVGFVYEGIPITADAQSFESFKQLIASLQYTNTLITRESELIQTYGDAELVKAYLACLGTSPAIRSRVSEHGNRLVTIAVEYRPSGSGARDARVRSFKVSSSTTTTKIEEVTNGCKPGASIPAAGGVGDCRVILRATSAVQDIIVQVDTTEGNATAFVPPRMVLTAKPDRILQKFDVNGGAKGVEEVQWNAPGGNIHQAMACTALPAKTYVVVSQTNPSVIVGPSLGYFGDNIGQGRINTPQGIRPQVCFQANCGHSGGGFPHCAMHLEGDMHVIAWTPKEESPEEVLHLVDQVLQLHSKGIVIK